METETKQTGSLVDAIAVLARALRKMDNCECAYEAYHRADKSITETSCHLRGNADRAQEEALSAARRVVELQGSLMLREEQGGGFIERALEEVNAASSCLPTLKGIKEALAEERDEEVSTALYGVAMGLVEARSLLSAAAGRFQLATSEIVPGNGNAPTPEATTKEER